MPRKYCTCPGFQSLVDRNIIKYATHQILRKKTAELAQIAYYFIGPKNIREYVILRYCPACGKQIKVNAQFYADEGVFPPTGT
ncbi:hypothetical protein [Deinococcus ruber]|uniref:Uncharacterized protein n=1 Tax=Deinococcus ruber TaxID=1848197 RepID=A0A918CE49_9DEIO|nr:hypothetical protein [Deinococcus ruber]GGR16569.1 hypothetical protein GCM10008957_31520 [Deinococcus ruber]